MTRAAAELRERGQEPVRDLWPGIDAAITAAERQQLRPRIRRRVRWIPWTAAAAVAVLLAAGGWWGLHRDTGRPLADPDPARVAMGGDPSPALATPEDDLNTIAAALDEVKLALAADPDNRSLTNLAMMLHRSRGRVLLQSDEMHVTGS